MEDPMNTMGCLQQSWNILESEHLSTRHASDRQEMMTPMLNGVTRLKSSLSIYSSMDEPGIILCSLRGGPCLFLLFSLQQNKSDEKTQQTPTQPFFRDNLIDCSLFFGLQLRTNFAISQIQIQRISVGDKSKKCKFSEYRVRSLGF